MFLRHHKKLIWKKNILGLKPNLELLQSTRSGMSLGSSFYAQSHELKSSSLGLGSASKAQTGLGHFVGDFFKSR